MANNFPKRSEIFKGDMGSIRDTVARPSLDTLYQVHFSFGNYDKWLEESSVRSDQKRTQGRGFQRKMSLMCTQAELPGTSFVETNVIGHHQGIQESFPNLRNFPPLNLVFYADADHVIIEVLESWMSYINPIFNSGIRDSNAFTRFNYPEDYKETIHVTKFERDTFIRESRNASYQSDITSYEFVNVWPIDLTSMRVAYGDSNVLRCSVQFAYDRFFTTFNYNDIQKQVVNTPIGVVNSKEVVAANTPVNQDPAVEGGYTMSKNTAIMNTDQLVRMDNRQYGNTVPPGSFGITPKVKQKRKTSRGSRY